MFVSISLICKRLPGDFLYIVHGNFGDELNLLSVEFLTPNTIPQNDIIYVVDLLKNEEINSQNRFKVLITIGKPQKKLIDQCECLLEFPESESVLNVFNSVSAAFYYYNHWDSQLQKIIMTQGSIQSLLDCSAEIFGNPIGIHNAALECIAETNAITEAGDFRMYLNTSSQRMDPDYLKGFLEDRDFQSSLLYKGAFFQNSSNSGNNSLAQNFFVDGEFSCRIVITERKNKLSPADAKLLEHLSEYIQLLLCSYCNNGLNTDARSFGLFLSDIIGGKVREGAYISKKIQEHGWRSSDCYACVVFALNSRETFTSTSDAICKHLKKLISGSEVFKHEDRIVAVINVGQPNTDMFEILQCFTSYMRDMNMKAGVSNILCGIKNLVNIYKQAEIALKIGLRLWSHFWIHRFCCVAPYYVMEQSISELSVEAACSPKIMELLRYDALHRTEYYHTVKAYLECNLHLARTSQMLFIHRTTLLYRLDRIKQLFDLVFNDPLERMYYQLSISLISYTAFEFDN